MKMVILLAVMRLHPLPAPGTRHPAHPRMYSCAQSRSAYRARYKMDGPDTSEEYSTVEDMEEPL
jgi:hypothetical protein